MKEPIENECLVFFGYDDLEITDLDKELRIPFLYGDLYAAFIGCIFQCIRSEGRQ